MSDSIQEPSKRILFRIFAYVLGILLLGLVILGVVLFWYYKHAKTEPYGQTTSTQLRENVQISFDAANIPHIDAKSSNDAFFALGYLHARERGWQMEFNRRLASGSLSEIFGEQTLSIDKFIRTLGIRTAARQQFEALPGPTKLSIEAYVQGVNAGFADIGNAMPLEFILTHTKPSVWTPIDSVSWSLMMALDLGDNWNKEFARLKLSKDLSTEEIWQVMPPYPGDKPLTNIDFAKMYQEQNIFATASKESSQSSIPDQTLAAWLPMGQEGKGSNNWVIAGDKTVSGKPLLANDPHLGLSSPSSWYFAHLKSNEMNVIGGTIPGLPGVILGHTNTYAWGFTNTAPDVQDLYIEQTDPNNPAKYRTTRGLGDFKIRRETILIKDQNPITLLVRETEHGPIISDVYSPAKELLKSNYILAFKWTALDSNNRSMKALIDMNRAKDIEDFKIALQDYSAPMQNVVMADINGKVSYQAAGIAPKRLKNPSEMMGVAPVFGWVVDEQWKEYLSPSELPQLNDQSLIATANQKVEKEDSPYTLTADWTAPYRYQRIMTLLEGQKKHDIHSMQQIQNDTVSNSALPLLEMIKQVESTHPLASKAKLILEKFDGDMLADQAAPLIFNAWVDHLTRNIFAARLGSEFSDLYAKRGLREGLINVLENHSEHWCGDEAASSNKRCAKQSQAAFDTALTYLSLKYGNHPEKWKWGDAHRAIGTHHPFSQVSFLRNYFELQTPSAGDSHTINVGKMSFNNLQQPYSSNVAPGMRVIYDLSDLNQSVFIGFGGQSGWVQSPRYKSYLSKWASNAYLPLSLTPSEPPVGTLLLKPSYTLN